VEYLSEACEYFLARNPRIRDDRTISHYRTTVGMFSRFLGRRARLSDLTEDSVSQLMVWIVRNGCSPVTANHRRKNLVSLWNWLAKRNLVDTWPTVEKMTEPKRVPRAWTQEQLARLIDACRNMPGSINGYVPASDFWLAWHGVAWDTGARTSEMFAMKWSWLDRKNGILHVPAEVRKGKRNDAIYQLMPDTLEVVLRLDQGADRIFFGIGHPTALWNRYTRLLKRAGLPTDRYCKPQKMRRTHASYLKISGGDPTGSLGHSSDAVTRASYLDPSICQSPPASRLFRILNSEFRELENQEPEKETG
jgi:integrase